MDSKKCHKIREIVRLQQILKKWKKVANASKNSSASDSAPTSASSSKGIKFLKRTLSFTDVSAASSQHHHQDMVVPKGFLAVCVGEELKRFIIPTDYLRHQAFELLLREAEEEFGFQQEGVLKIPCQVSVFEKILKVVQDNTKNDKNITSCEVTTPTHHAQVYCR